ncbi:MAG: glycosyltransferase [Flavobacteriales bacterium]|nr:glycosyltransferase [Flavobacteriales bacterium]
MSPKVSIVVTCYNLGAYVQEALDSIAAYTGPAQLEVIVVDDGSTDAATRAVVAGLDRSRCTVLEQTNMGLAKARNNGIALATGSYIISLDADNRIHPAFIERSISVLDREPEVGVVYGDAVYFEGRTGPWKVGAFDFTRLVQSNYIDACACYRRSIWERVGGYDEHMPHMGWEDWDFWLRCSVAGVQFRYVEEAFFDYRVRAGSMIHDTRKREAELVAYIFAKPQLRFLAPLREQFMRLKRGSREHLSNGELVDLLTQRLRAKFKRTLGGKGTP